MLFFSLSKLNPTKCKVAVLTFCLFGSACQKVTEEIDPQLSIRTSNLRNQEDYLVFESRGEFEEVMNTIDDLGPDQSINEHLAKWEEEHGSFRSMRQYYNQLESQGDTTSICPAEDIYFATVLSPKGVIQINHNIYKIDFINENIYYINEENKANSYDDLMNGNTNENIYYYRLTEDVFDLFAGGDIGSKAGQDRHFQLGSGIGCGNGAPKQKDPEVWEYDKKYRLDSKVVYQPMGIYFSLVAESKHQHKVAGIWWAAKACMSTFANPGAIWREKCNSSNEFYSRDDSNNCGIGLQDNNQITVRPYNGTKGLQKLNYTIQFRLNSQFATRDFQIRYLL